jgi:hypothetical protein
MHLWGNRFSYDNDHNTEKCRDSSVIEKSTIASHLSHIQYMDILAKKRYPVNPQ